jgi:Spy/CpxP family protein refolding chaperone
MRARFIFLVSFFSAFAAGVTVGLVWSKPVPQGVGGPGGPGGHRGSRDPMAELQLTPEQSEKIKGFWTEAMKSGNWQFQREQREAAQKTRDDAYRAMLSEEQKARQDELNRSYQAKLDELNAISKRARDEAYEKTQSILSDAQRKVYEEMRKRRWDDRGRSRGGPPEPGGPGGPVRESSTESAKEKK